MTAQDIEIYHKWRNDIGVMQTTAPLLDVHGIEETEEFVHQVILGSHSSKCYIILEKQSKKPIGITSLINIDYKNRNESWHDILHMAVLQREYIEKMREN